MALADRVTARLSSQRLIELTNPDNAGASTVDTDRLGYACTDVEADFEIYAGVEYDDDDARHVSVAIDGVIDRLAGRQGLVADEVRDRWIARIEALRKVTGNNRITPTTSSQLTPSDEAPNGIEVRPDFDRTNLGGMTLRAPRAPFRRTGSVREEE